MIARAARGVLLLLGLLGPRDVRAHRRPRASASPFRSSGWRARACTTRCACSRGQPLYAAPSAEFIAYLYPPLAYAADGARRRAVRAVACGGARRIARLHARSRCWRSGAPPLAARARVRPAALPPGCSRSASATPARSSTWPASTPASCCWSRSRRSGCSPSGRAPRCVWLALSAFAKQHGLLLLAAVSVALLAARAAAPRGRRRAGSRCRRGVRGARARERRLVRALHARAARGPRLRTPALLRQLLRGRSAAVPAGAGRELRARAAAAHARAHAHAVRRAAASRRCSPGRSGARTQAATTTCGCPRSRCSASRAHRARPRARAAPAPPRRSGRVWLLLAFALQFALLWQAPCVPRAQAGERARRSRRLRAALLRAARRARRAVALDHARLTATPFLHTMALSDLRSGGDAALARAGTAALLARAARPRRARRARGRRALPRARARARRRATASVSSCVRRRSRPAIDRAIRVKTLSFSRFTYERTCMAPLVVKNRRPLLQRGDDASTRGSDA